MTSQSSRVTIPDVAREAGVSTAAAGRALGGYGYVSDEVRAKVVKTAQALGYRRNELARSLITGRTQTIGVVCADIANPFFAGAMRGIGNVTAEHDYQTILTNSDEDREIEREAVQVLLDKQVDGIIIALADPTDVSHLQAAIDQGTQVVLLDRECPSLQADTVVVDNVTASAKAVTHLIELGHTQIAIVAELDELTDSDIEALAAGNDLDPRPDSDKPSVRRLMGYLEAHHRAGLPVKPENVLRTGEYSRRGARDVVRTALGSSTPPTALFTVDSLMSAGAFGALREWGGTIPDELSLVAFDDLEWMEFVSPGVTAVCQPVRTVGAAAADLLISRLGSSETLPPRREVIETSLVIRGSSAPPPR